MERLLRKLADGYGDVGVVCVSCRHDVVSMRGLLSGFARLSQWELHRIRDTAAEQSVTTPYKQECTPAVCCQHPLMHIVA